MSESLSEWVSGWIGQSVSWFERQREIKRAILIINQVVLCVLNVMHKIFCT